ncbi:MAG TPA: Txe/YoeB family addiction module toxin [Rickettsia endosymbiont of Bembidion lapponicum]|nr:Txe/YoeB family addiction module toxin [Rickettsia endosymbiont of Bembidion lapponicum]
MQKKILRKLKNLIIKIAAYNYLDLIAQNPFQIPPPYKKLSSIYEGMYSRRINIQHRLFYEVDEKNKRIKVLKIWNHYYDN